MHNPSLHSLFWRGSLGAAAWLAGASFARAAYTSNPAPTVTWNSSTEAVLFKDLNGTPHYGALDHAVDLFSSGDSATWTFDVTAAGIDPTSVVGCSISLSISLDSSALNKQNYYFDISTPITGDSVYPGTVFNHGAPAAGPFTNWSSLSPYASFTPGSFPAVLTVSGSANMIYPANGPADFIAVDSITVTIEIAPPPPPTLYITNSSPGMLTIGWAPATAGYVLQSTDSLSTPNWVSEASGSANPVTVDSTAPARFYRLVKLP